MVTESKDLLKSRLERYLDKLKSGEKVNARDLTSVLTPAEIERMNADWENAQGYKQSVIDMGAELSSYTKKLHTADKIYGIGENYSNLPAANRKRRYQDAEKHYEEALEHLDEILDRNLGVQIALDRPVSFDPESAPTASAADVPRYVFSRSHHTQQREWETIKSIRIGALEEKLRGLEQATCAQPSSKPDCEQKTPTDSADRARKLRKLLR